MSNNQLNDLLKITYAFDKQSLVIWKALTLDANQLKKIFLRLKSSGLLNKHIGLANATAKIMSLCSVAFSSTIDHSNSLRAGKFKLAVEKEKLIFRYEKELNLALNELMQETDEAIRDYRVNKRLVFVLNNVKKILKQMISQNKIQIKLSKKIEKINYIAAGVY